MATMLIEAQWEEPRRTSLRKVRRSSMSLPALIFLFGKRHSAQLHNLSRGGAMIQSAAPVKACDQIVLSCGTIEARGRVVWTKLGGFGVEFDCPLDDEEITRQLDRSDAVMSRRDLRGRTTAAEGPEKSAA
jgi:PilZ domain-containing protein